MTTVMTRDEMRRAVGELIICGFEGEDISSEVREVMREVSPMGFILFARNISEARQAAELNVRLKELRPEQIPLVAVDQEGGRVARVRKGATLWPPMRRLGIHNRPELARRVGAALGREMRALNFDVDFAPILDVDTNPNNPVIGDRAFSSDEIAAAKLGAAFIEGMQGAQVGACGKHFPGHGDTDVDSHLALPTVRHDLERLKQIEWAPFRAAIEVGVSSIMTAHVVVEFLDSVPATLSRRLLSDILRSELGFSGVIVSDDIDMRGLADVCSAKEAGPRALLAGCDVFLACRDPQNLMDLYRGLVLAYEKKEITADLLVAARQRARQWRARYVQPAVVPETTPGGFAARMGLSEHAELAEELAGPPF